MERSFRFLVIMLVFATSSLSSCSQESGAISSKSNCLNLDEINYFNNLKNAYYQQRFIEADTNTYYSRDGYAIGADNPESSVYNPLDAIVQAEINSIDDLKVFYVYYLNDNLCIVSFKYQEMGESGAWFSQGATIHFIGKNKEYDVTFIGNNFAPEVFYQGQFYYIQEAYKLGLFTIENENLIITSHDFYEKDGEITEFINGYMLGRIIDL